MKKATVTDPYVLSFGNKRQCTQVSSGTRNPGKITLFGSSNTPEHLRWALPPAPFCPINTSDVQASPFSSLQDTAAFSRGQAPPPHPEPQLWLRFFQRLENTTGFLLCGANSLWQLWGSREYCNRRQTPNSCSSALPAEKQALCNLVEGGTKPHENLPNTRCLHKACCIIYFSWKENNSRSLTHALLRRSQEVSVCTRTSTGDCRLCCLCWMITCHLSKKKKKVAWHSFKILKCCHSTTVQFSLSFRVCIIYNLYTHRQKEVCKYRLCNQEMLDLLANASSLSQP